MNTNPEEQFNYIEGMMKISDREFQQLRNLIYRQFGINLTEQKKGLLVGRLQKLIRDMGLSSFQEYYQYILRNHKSGALVDLVNRVSTNYTYFNREKEHFEYLRTKALPELIQDPTRRLQKILRVWCAASSTGEEAYMLVMLMMEVLGEDYWFWDAGVLATDISDRALSVARKGIYLADQVKQLPKHYLSKYFDNLGNGHYQVKQRIRKEVTFRRFNLITPVFPFKRPFDIIFCRNVMIYFDQETKDRLVAKLNQFTSPGGYLFVGHAETIVRNNTSYHGVIPAAYRKG